MTKKILVCVFGLGVLLMLAACQSTPEEDIIVEKDQERMIEAASVDNGETKDIPIREQLSIPETFDLLFSGADGKLIINVDAEVSTPDTDAMPIYRVGSTGFSEGFSDSVFQLLCKGTSMYAASESFTKDAIMTEILIQQQTLASSDLDDVSREGIEDYIEQLKLEYESAPDTMGAPITSVVFQTKKENGKSYTLFEARENEAGEGGRYFLVRNDAEYKNEELEIVDGEIVAPRSNAKLRYLDSDIRPSAELYEVREVIEETQIDGLKTTPSEAQTIAEDVLNAIGVDDMEIYSIYLMSDMPEGSGVDALYCYNVKLRRKVDGICVNSPEYCTFVDDPSYGFQWDYETFSIGISDDGIYAFDWKAPLEISEVVVSDSTLMPFEDVMDIFKSMMCIVNEPEAQIADSYETIEFEITDITLSLQRISEQNSVTSGLLVPVWNFYGDKVYTYQDGTSYIYSERAKLEATDDSVESIHYPFLSINAIDGSIIDPSLGY